MQRNLTRHKVNLNDGDIDPPDAAEANQMVAEPKVTHASSGKCLSLHVHMLMIPAFFLQVRAIMFP
jgi:hypothetical protein